MSYYNKILHNSALFFLFYSQCQHYYAVTVMRVWLFFLLHVELFALFILNNYITIRSTITNRSIRSSCIFPCAPAHFYLTFTLYRILESLLNTSSFRSEYLLRSFASHVTARLRDHIYILSRSTNVRAMLVGIYS